MKYPYKISLPSSILWFLFFRENNHAALEYFLARELPIDFLYYLELINRGLTNLPIPEHTTGNVCHLTVAKNFTKIEYLFPEDEEIEVSCTIETEELRKLIILWSIEVEKFSKIKQSPLFKSIDPNYTIYCFLASIYHQFVDNFDQLLDLYLASETKESRTQLFVVIEQFLKSDQSIETKNEYIQLCADAVNFDQLQITPIAWLEIIANYIKNSRNANFFINFMLN